MSSSNIDRGKMDEAIAKHARWKHYLRQAVETGQSDWTDASVRRDDQCEFGKWLTSIPVTEKQNEHYTKVKDLHAQFHRAAAEILALALSGRGVEAGEQLALGSQFTKISSQLVVAISAWKKSIT